MYQDCFEKPSELVLFRQTKDGGLGLFNVKIRSLSCLIRTFLETAVNPSFRHNLYHEVLFRYHVLGEESLPDPGIPPFYDKKFFSTIRHYHENSPLNVAVMSTKQWYSVLMEDQVLMQPATDSSPPALIQVRAESLSPSNDWTHSWRLARIKGLESQLSTFLFKLLHQLLPTQERVQRLGGTEDNLPGLCKLCHTEVEDLSHAFFYCPQSRVSGLALLGWVQGVAPTLQPEDALQLTAKASNNVITRR